MARKKRLCHFETMEWRRVSRIEPASFSVHEAEVIVTSQYSAKRARAQISDTQFSPASLRSFAQIIEENYAEMKEFESGKCGISIREDVVREEPKAKASGVASISRRKDKLKKRSSSAVSKGSSFDSPGTTERSSGREKSKKPARKAQRKTNEEQRANSTNAIDSSSGGTSQSSATSNSQSGSSANRPKAAPPVVLSRAKASDEIVKNDILKVVIVGAESTRATWLLQQLTGKKSKGPVRGAEVKSWNPMVGVSLKVWNAQGSTPVHENQTSPWAHPTTQSLYTTDGALHILLWDLEGSLNRNDSAEVSPDVAMYMDSTSGSGEYQALQADIAKNVLPWIDIVGQSGLNSAILPVAVIPEGMTREDAELRCQIMQRQLDERVAEDTPTILEGMADRVILVDMKGNGIAGLRESLVEIATNPWFPLFRHVGSLVPPGTVLLRKTVKRLAKSKPVVPVSYLQSELRQEIDPQQVMRAIQFLSSIGDLLYYGDRPCASGDTVLSHFVILERRWLASALSCLLREDLKSKVSETRDSHGFEGEVNTLVPELDTEGCPLISGLDAPILWLGNKDVLQSFEDCQSLIEPSSRPPTVIHFLEKLLLRSGVTVPLSMEPSPIFPNETLFIPSVLQHVNPHDVWTYKSREAWTTTLCYSWVFRHGAPSTLMEYLSVVVLRDLNDFARSFAENTELWNHTTASSVDYERVYGVKIHKAVCWKTCFVAKIEAQFRDSEGALFPSCIEVYVAVVDRNSPNCVASDARTKIGMDRVIVSCKGPRSHSGALLWNGGFRVILQCVRQALQDYDIAELQVVCPSCLESSYTRTARTLSWGEVQSCADRHDEAICTAGHRISSHLLCGKVQPENVQPHVPREKRHAAEIRPSTVFVGAMRPGASQFSGKGSGFILDESLGLVITAAHVLYDMRHSETYGAPLGDLDRVVIGVVPHESHGASHAVLRYYARVITTPNIRIEDACVLKITSRLEDDVEYVGQDFSHVHDIALDDDEIVDEGLVSLRLANDVCSDESVRLFGYKQTGGHRTVNLKPSFSKGHVEREWVASSSVHSEFSPLFSPNREVVVKSKTSCGQSGGPCVNKVGSVVGILSTGDQNERSVSYLVPISVLVKLARAAKRQLAEAPFPSPPTETFGPPNTSGDQPMSPLVAFENSSNGSRAVSSEYQGVVQTYEKHGYDYVGFVMPGDKDNWMNGDRSVLMNPAAPQYLTGRNEASAPASFSALQPPTAELRPFAVNHTTQHPQLKPEEALGNFSAIDPLRRSVVMIGIWTPTDRTTIAIGSGFIADAGLGLIVTSQFVMDSHRPSLASGSCRVVIGVVPQGGRNAVFKYFASPVTIGDQYDDIKAIVLQIDGGVPDERDRNSRATNASETPGIDDKLEYLEMTDSVSRRQRVRVLGFTKPETSVIFANATVEDASLVSHGGEEIVITCPAMPDDSGCPCVNNDGHLVGMLTRVVRQNGYLVPTTDLQALLRSAKRRCRTSRIARLSNV